MERLDAFHLAKVLLAAPAWARIGLAVCDGDTRARAAQALADVIVERTEAPPPVDDRQLALPMR